jgi:adenosylhomocysteine nucleosidase
MKTVSLVCLAVVLGLCTVRAAPAARYDPTPRIGILVPRLPADYGLLFDALRHSATVSDGAFDFRTGDISGVAVVLIVQPGPGEVLRSIEATAMMHDFNIRLLLYPGTSGGHLPAGQMAPGDIVLGARNVNHGNYYLAPDGRMEAGTFKDPSSGRSYTGAFDADPALLPLLACSASRVASRTRLPEFVAPVRADRHPQVFYYGIQGTSEIWSDNSDYTNATMRVFHEIDEDGDWYSNLAANLMKVPFLEVSVISNSIFAFPSASHGTPEPPAGEPDSHVMAQRLSNRIVLDLIEREGPRLLSVQFKPQGAAPRTPQAYFDTPLEPRRLLDGCPP